jgi:hypothetical protein
LVLQPDPLKLGSFKFNVIINIINITLGYSFVKKPNTFRS